MNKLVLKALCKKNEIMGKLKRGCTKAGSQTTDWLIIAVFVVIIGAALIILGKTAFPDLFESIIDRISGILDTSAL
ncbi:MAG: hypothetical protein PUF72_05610 [Clostridiales bacterium]|nr:hypothetical protein [Clostridiales bacterium]